MYLLDCSSSISTSTIISILAFILSVIALLVNRSNSLKGIRLTIQQSIIKVISEKVNDCNTIWEEQSDKQFIFAENKKLLSELVITIEILEKILKLHSANDSEILKSKNDYYSLFWKQLRTDLRGWIERLPETLKNKIPEDKYYTQQAIDVYNTFMNHFDEKL